jgi:hypothetical protein
MQIDIDLEKMLLDSLGKFFDEQENLEDISIVQAVKESFSNYLNNDEEAIANFLATNGIEMDLLAFWYTTHKILKIETLKSIDFEVSKLVSHVCNHLENQE